MINLSRGAEAPPCLATTLANVAHVVKPYPAHVVPVAASVSRVRFPALRVLDGVLIHARLTEPYLLPPMHVSLIRAAERVHGYFSIGTGV